MSDERHETDSASGEWQADLELLAIEEQFIAEQEAGKAPRLSTYLLRYPQHAEALAAFVIEYLSPLGEITGEDVPAEAPGGARPLSKGTQRALDALFGERDDAQRVAERREEYSVDEEKEAGE